MYKEKEHKVWYLTFYYYSRCYVVLRLPVRLLFKVRHVGTCNRTSINLHHPQSRDFTTLIVFNKESQTLDALVLDKLELDWLGTLFQVLCRQMKGLRRVHVFAIFKAKVLSVHEKMDLGRIRFGVHTTVELCQFYRADLER
jgi:hypothetical protein